jgi:hypothetical protein
MNTEMNIVHEERDAVVVLSSKEKVNKYYEAKKE